MKAKPEETKQKLRGGYYTPRPVARYLAEWALAGGAERVLEPSCGDGRIVEALLEEARSERGRGGEGAWGTKLAVDAVELFEEEARKARAKARNGEEVADVTVRSRDFFGWVTSEASKKRWGAVVGNPPYIRYQYFDEEQRDRAARVARRAGMTFSKLTNAWVPFAVAAVRALRPGGRLAMVVPSEILHIQYAKDLRLLLEQEMQSLALVSLREIVFEGTLQGTLLLLGERREAARGSLGRQRSLFDEPPPSAEEAGGGGPEGAQATSDAQAGGPSGEAIAAANTRSLSLIDVGSAGDLPDPKALPLEEERPGGGHARPLEGEWMKALLAPEELRLIERLEARSEVRRLGEIADVKTGIVTGANEFFVVDESTLAEYRLEDIAAPMLARARHAGGLEYTKEDHRANSAEGRRVYLLHFPKDRKTGELPERWQAYLREGEEQKLHERYKCRVREPWYRVPYVWAGALAMPKGCHRYPRMIRNEAGAFSTDTLYRIEPRARFSGRERDLAFSFLNSLTLLQAEIHGRHYGGGVLELVPSEINRLRVPLARIEDAAFEKVDKMLRGGAKLEELRKLTDEIVLRRGFGLSEEETGALQTIHDRYMHRRLREERPD